MEIFAECCITIIGCQLNQQEKIINEKKESLFIYYITFLNPITRHEVILTINVALNLSISLSFLHLQVNI